MSNNNNNSGYYYQGSHSGNNTNSGNYNNYHSNSSNSYDNNSYNNTNGFNNNYDNNNNYNNANGFNNNYDNNNGNNNNYNNNKKSPNGKGRKAKKVFKIIGTVALTISLIIIITGSILATALTIYVMNFMDNTSQVSLDSASRCYNSVFYSKNTEGELVPIYTIGSQHRSIWVDIDEIPQNVRAAFVYAEDARFYTHEGVDFKRTFAATANFLLHIYGNNQGGSTITQQTIKNITGDDDQDPTRKVREIFASLDLEKRYSKTEILEAYMNVINTGGNYYGVEIAAQYYFDKHAKDLTIAEAATIVAITKSPNANNPILSDASYEKNKARKEYIINEMYKNGAISSEERDAALAQKLEFVGDNKILDEDEAKNTSVTSYFVDAAILDAKNVLCDTLKITSEKAEEKLQEGGYQIYTNEDPTLQSMLEKKYLDYKTFQNYEVPDGPQSAGILMDYNGNVLAYVGAIGEKADSRISVFAMQGLKPPGSTIKPIASYGPAIELNKITWSTMIKDDYLKVKQPDGSMDYFTIDRGDDDKYEGKWPLNWDLKYTNKYQLACDHLAQSLNTGAAAVNDLVTYQYSYEFLKNKLHLSLVDGDNARAPMTIGDLTHGIHMLDMVATYQAWGNGGKYYKPHFINKITDASGKIVWENPYNAEQVFTPETAWIMNRMLKYVVDYNSPKYNQGINCELIGKTGTSNNNHDNWFIGCTPQYVGGIWIGDFDKQRDIRGIYHFQYQVWNNVFDEIMNTGTVKNFTPNNNVVEAKYDKTTGIISESGTGTGYYKKDNMPTDPQNNKIN